MGEPGQEQGDGEGGQDRPEGGQGHGPTQGADTSHGILVGLAPQEGAEDHLEDHEAPVRVDGLGQPQDGAGSHEQQRPEEAGGRDLEPLGDGPAGNRQHDDERERHERGQERLQAGRRVARRR